MLALRSHSHEVTGKVYAISSKVLRLGKYIGSHYLMSVDTVAGLLSFVISFAELMLIKFSRAC